MMVGMRLLAGVSEKAFRDRFGRGLLEVYEQKSRTAEKDLVNSKTAFTVTEQGLYLENHVSGAFLRSVDSTS